MVYYVLTLIDLLPEWIMTKNMDGITLMRLDTSLSYQQIRKTIAKNHFFFFLNRLKSLLNL